MMEGTQAGMQELLEQAAGRATRYLENLETRKVFPTAEALERLEELGGELPAAPTDASEVLRLLDEVGSPGTVASAGRRYFGFVTGGAVTVAANWLASAWDQNAGLEIQSPVNAALEAIAVSWLVKLLGLSPRRRERT